MAFTLASRVTANIVFLVYLICSCFSWFCVLQLKKLPILCLKNLPTYGENDMRYMRRKDAHKQFPRMSLIARTIIQMAIPGPRGSYSNGKQTRPTDRHYSWHKTVTYQDRTAQSQNCKISKPNQKPTNRAHFKTRLPPAARPSKTNKQTNELTNRAHFETRCLTARVISDLADREVPKNQTANSGDSGFVYLPQSPLGGSVKIHRYSPPLQ